MEISIKKGENSTYTASVKIPAEDVTKLLDEALVHEAENVEIKGFRKGKAPLDLVKEKLDFAKLRSHALNHLLPDVYSQIVKENKLLPIIDPRFEIEQFEECKDLLVKVILVERPEIKLKDYKSALIKKYIDKSTELTHEEVVSVVVENSEVGLADLLVEEEANRMLSSLIDQLAKMGLNIEQYLDSVKKKPDEVRGEYLKISRQTLHADFAITEIATKEGYVVDETEINKTIEAVPDEKSRELLSKPEQRAYIKAVLIKSKTLSKLSEIAKSESKSSKDNSKKEDK